MILFSFLARPADTQCKHGGCLGFLVVARHVKSAYLWSKMQALFSKTPHTLQPSGFVRLRQCDAREERSSILLNVQMKLMNEWNHVFF